jgi:hypothetical protein
MGATGCSVKTACPYCGVGCGVIATPQTDGSVAIAGDPDHPANFGKLCSKAPPWAKRSRSMIGCCIPKSAERARELG